MHVVGMTLSNAAAGGLVLLYAKDGIGERLARLVLSALTMALIAARQQSVLVNCDMFNTGDLERELRNVARHY
jgi:hypothetical protein